MLALQDLNSDDKSDSLMHLRNRHFHGPSAPRALHNHCGKSLECAALRPVKLHVNGKRYTRTSRAPKAAMASLSSRVNLDLQLAIPQSCRVKRWTPNSFRLSVLSADLHSPLCPLAPVTLRKIQGSLDISIHRLKPVDCFGHRSLVGHIVLLHCAQSCFQFFVLGVQSSCEQLRGRGTFGLGFSDQQVRGLLQLAVGLYSPHMLILESLPKPLRHLRHGLSKLLDLSTEGSPNLVLLGRSLGHRSGDESIGPFLLGTDVLLNSRSQVTLQSYSCFGLGL
mmetsp:Transcript_28117/g.59786  ORF Transcript_28117/g.59786 Transcript_28117/m.59786 type:complete len:279 (+) Transcript_28117:868-1704(+)